MSVQTTRKINRYEKILLSLSKLTYATNDQLRAVNNLGGSRNTRRILSNMEQDGYIKSVRYSRKIYYVSNKGNDMIGKHPSRLQRKEIQHTLMRNDLYIWLSMPITWKKEAPVLMNGKTILISDARYKVGNKYYFIEIDNQQTMQTNYDKIKKYKKVFEAIKDKYETKLIWYTMLESRKEKIKKSCKNAGIDYEVW